MSSFQEHIIDRTGDLDVIIQDHKFRVSSAVMASLSTPFSLIFKDLNGAERPTMPAKQRTLPMEPSIFRQVAQSAHGDSISQSDIDTLMDLEHAISLFDEEPDIYHRIVQSGGDSQSDIKTLVDLVHALLVHKVTPDVFHFIAQSAHGIFFPWTDVSIDTLVGLAQAVLVYKVPVTADIYASINYAFVSHTAIPASIEVKNLPKFARIAEVLGPKLLMPFLQDIFDVHCCHWVPVSVSNYCDQLLANVILLVVGTRAKIGQRLLGNSPNRLLSAAECQIFTWLIEEKPSLSMIQSRFQAEISTLQSDESLYYRLLECLEFIDSCRSGITTYLFVMISPHSGNTLESYIYAEAYEQQEKCEVSPVSPSVNTEWETSSVDDVKTWPMAGREDEDRQSTQSYATY